MPNTLERWFKRRWLGSAAPDDTEMETGIEPSGPRPSVPAGLQVDPSEALRRAAAAAPRALAWARAGIADPAAWQETVRTKLAEISGYGRFGGPPAIVHREDAGESDGLRHERVYLRVRHGHDIPVRVVSRTAAGDAPRPAVICLQGRALPMRVSWGAFDTAAEEEAVRLGRDFARQAVRRGYHAVCIEQPGVGERQSASVMDAVDAAHPPLAAMVAHALIIGRCVLGEHASDVSSVLNWMLDGAFGRELSGDRPAVIGYGGGGLTGLLASALDPRIGAAVAVDALGHMREATQERMIDLSCVVPGLLRWMDVEDIVALCAPRPVLGVSTGLSSAAPADDAQTVIDLARPVFAQLGAEDAVAHSRLQGSESTDPAAVWQWAEELLSASSAPDARETRPIR